MEWNVSSPILQRKNDPGPQNPKNFIKGQKIAKPKSPLISECERFIKLQKIGKITESGSGIFKH